MNWTVIRRLATAWVRDRRQFSRPILKRLCPICGHSGIMIGVGHPPRWDARCAQCGSRERHRLLWLWVIQDGSNRLAGKRVLHFAPEKALRRALGRNPGYETADLSQRGVTHSVDITCLPMVDGTYDFAIANHVLEHVDDDRAAMHELFRILKPGGAALLTVPMNATRARTYENPAITDPAERHAHFTAADHRRHYGRDFTGRLQRVGFCVDTFRMAPPEEVTYGLLPTDVLFIARRPV